MGQPACVARLPDVLIGDPPATKPELSILDVLARAAGLPPLATAVAHPCDESSLAAVLAARDRRLVAPILVGSEGKIRSLAAAAGLDRAGIPMRDVPHSHASAARAVELVGRAEVGAIMKGSLHTDELLGEVMRADAGLQTARRISHVFVMQVPGLERLLLVTDAAVNSDPGLEEKVDIVQNAIDLAVVLGVSQPRVAILSAVETVTSKLRSTIDAAALCMMAERGQITGGLLDGPLAFDNAVSLEAARVKGITSEVRRVLRVGLSAAAVETMLTRESGLLGVSGISGDMRVLLESADPRAEEAVELFCERAAREITSLAAALGGLDAVVFTAGIGEQAPAIRERICAKLRWLGLELDPATNAVGGPRTSMLQSRIAAWVIPTDEEGVIAAHTQVVTASRR